MLKVTLTTFGLQTAFNTSKKLKACALRLQLTFTSTLILQRLWVLALQLLMQPLVVSSSVGRYLAEL